MRQWENAGLVFAPGLYNLGDAFLSGIAQMPGLCIHTYNQNQLYPFHPGDYFLPPLFSAFRARRQIA